MRAGRFALLIVFTCGGLFACGGRPLSPPPPPAPAGPEPVMRAHYIDVGQGDATLLEFPCGAVLIDTGGEDHPMLDGVGALSAYLDGFFARRADLERTLDLVVVTHSHIDHTRGLPMILERYPVRNVVDSGLERSSGAEQVALLHAHLRARPEVGHRDVALGDLPSAEGLTDEVIDPVRCDDVDPEIRVLWGRVEEDPGWPENRWGSPFENDNNHSVAVRVDFGRASFLFTGDLEEEVLETFVARYRGTTLLDVDVYKVGHHGSRNGTTLALVRAMRPKIAVLSMGSPYRIGDWTAWRYGHPGGGVVELLDGELRERRPEVEVLVGRRGREFHPVRVAGALYGTGWEGTVVVEASTRGRLSVHTPSVAAQGD